MKENVWISILYALILSVVVIKLEYKILKNKCNEEKKRNIAIFIATLFFMIFLPDEYVKILFIITLIIVAVGIIVFSILLLLILIKSKHQIILTKAEIIEAYIYSGGGIILLIFFINLR